MIHVVRNIRRVGPGLVREFQGQSSATVHEAYGKRGALPSHIRPLSPEMHLCGPALTVACAPGDNLMLHKAVAVACPGDILVATVGGHHEAGYWGEILTIAAQARGISGLVIDGCVRDGSLIQKLGFPTFMRGLCIKGTLKESLGLINHPLAIGGVVVYPGDLILGDQDGVVVVAREEAEGVLQKARERERKEEDTKARLKAGRLTLDIYGFDKVLQAKGLHEEESV